MRSSNRVREARELLNALGMDGERSNERSALVLLALLGMRPGDAWSEAANPMVGTRAIMNWIRDEYGKDYAPNTRETIRRFTLHQFAEAHLVVQNPDQPDRPTNSPNWNYQLTTEALAVVQTYGTQEFSSKLAEYLAIVPGLKARYAAAREMFKIPLILPNGSEVTISPGGQNVLIKQIIEEFCPRYTPGAEILYIGDTDQKWALFESERLAQLGVTPDLHGKMPDLVAYMADRNWLVLMEAVSSHGPVDSKRHGELASLFSGSTAGLVYVSCFPDLAEYRKYSTQISWETEVWCADHPTHMIHHDGERYLGPYR